MSFRIHLGVHKTATTQMQFSLKSSGGKLREAGLRYLGPDDLRGDPLPVDRSLRAGKTKFDDRVRDGLAPILAGSGDHLISEENLIGTTLRALLFGEPNIIYPKARPRLEKLLSLLGDPQVHLLMSVRDPAQFLTSVFGQRLRSGDAGDIADFLDGFRVSSLSWTELARRLLEIPNVTGMTCWRYEDFRKLRPVVVEHLVGAKRAGLVDDAGIQHFGISHKAYLAFRRMAMSDFDSDLRDLLKRARELHPRAVGEPAMHPMRKRTYEASLRAYARDLDRLKRLDGVTFLEPDAPKPEAAP